MSWSVAVAIQIFASAGTQLPDLTAAAQASPRPPECVWGTVGQNGAWSRARVPGLTQHCLMLARGYARLSTQPSLSLLAADEAERATSGRAAPDALAGRALFALGRYADAYKRFQRAKGRDARSLEAPATLQAFAASALASGHEADALRAYRRLIPRAGLLARAQDRQRAYVEAALLAMGQGPDGLGEATGYVSEARRRGVVPGGGSLVLGTLALALDRQGRRDEARGVAREAGGPWSLAAQLEPDPPTAKQAQKLVLSTGAGRLPITRPGELHAVVAVLAEPYDAALAREQWQAFLKSSAGRSGPWTAHARQRVGSAGQR